MRLLLLFILVNGAAGYAAEHSGVDVYVAEKKDSLKILCSYTVVNKNALYAIRHFGLQGIRKKPLNWELNSKTGNLGSDMSPVGWHETLGKDNQKDIRTFSWDVEDSRHAIFNRSSQVFNIALPVESGSTCNVDSWEVWGEQRMTGKVQAGPVPNQ